MIMTGTGKDAAITLYIAGAVSAWSLTDINEILVALAMGAGFVLAVFRIAKTIKYWHDPSHKD